MKLSITGTVGHVGETETIGSKGFLKRIFTLDMGNDKWPNPVPFELHKEATENAPMVGEKVNVEFWLQGREWQGRYYLSAKVATWSGEAAKPTAKPTPKPSAPSANPAAALGLDEDASLPF